MREPQDVYRDTPCRSGDCLSSPNQRSTDKAKASTEPVALRVRPRSGERLHNPRAANPHSQLRYLAQTSSRIEGAIQRGCQTRDAESAAPTPVTPPPMIDLPRMLGIRAEGVDEPRRTPDVGW